jgi:hypothetical protein
MRDGARRNVFLMRSNESARAEVLRRMWFRACRRRSGRDACGRGCSTDSPRRRAPAGLGPLRRPRGLHHALRGPRRRRGARAPLPLLRVLQATDLALRRYGGEVHRRRGNGCLGDADGPGGRRRAGGAGGARLGGPGLGTGAGVGRRAASASRHPHRRGCGHARRRGRGHGRRRPRELGLTHPVGGRAWQRLRRRAHAPGERSGDCLRERGKP